jgi:hypothetical protein
MSTSRCYNYASAFLHAYKFYLVMPAYFQLCEKTGSAVFRQISTIGQSSIVSIIILCGRLLEFFQLWIFNYNYRSAIRQPAFCLQFFSGHPNILPILWGNRVSSIRKYFSLWSSLNYRYNYTVRQAVRILPTARYLIIFAYLLVAACLPLIISAYLYQRTPDILMPF